MKTTRLYRSDNAGGTELLGTESHKTSKNIQKSKHSRGTLLALSFILVFFFNLTLQKNWIVTELILRYLPTTSMFSAGEKSVFLIGSNQFKTQILACSLDFLENNDRNRIDCKIATGCIFICVFTDSALRFPLGVCIDMAEVAIGCIGLRFSGQYLYCRQACKCVYWFQPCWDS